MNIAGMRVRITIQRNETMIDKYGNHKSAWTDYFTCWASASKGNMDGLFHLLGFRLQGEHQGR